MFALLGNLCFETLTSPEVFRSASEYHFAEHKVIEAPPRLQWLANELSKISMELSFHVAFTSPILMMGLLRAAAADHQARPLIFGNGIHRGYFVIESLEETHQQMADDGSYIAISARVELREWIPGADFDPLAPPRRTTPPPGIVHKSNGVKTGAEPSITTGKPFDPKQPIGPHNLLPTNAIVQLSNAGAGPGVTYGTPAYSQPGVSGITGKGPGAVTPGNPGGVPPSTIVRAG